MQKCIKCDKSLPSGALFCCWCGKPQTVPARSVRKRGNGEGTVFRKPNGKWCAEYTLGYIKLDNGKIKRNRKTKSTFESKKEALDFLASVKDLKNTRIRADNKTVAELYDTIFERDIQELSETKISHYKTARKRLKDIEDIYISDLAVEDLQAVVDSIDSGFYPKRDVKNLLSKIYEQAIIGSYCDKDLSKYIKLPKLEATEKVIYQKEDISKLWDSWYSGSEISGYLLIMIHSGIRTGELRNIFIENVSLDNGVMYGGIKTVKGKSRPIIIISKIKPIVEYFCKKNKEKLCELSEYIFYKSFNRLKSELGLRDELEPNCSRHTCATALAEANVPPAVIIDILGHEKYQTSLNYTHINIDTLRKNLEKAI